MASNNESGAVSSRGAPRIDPDQMYQRLLRELSYERANRWIAPVDPDYDVLLAENPHVEQIASYPFQQRTSRDMRVRELFTLERTLMPTASTIAYRRRADEKKTVNHWGQRKLLLSQIEFLTLYARPNDTVVYAGAAPGTHTEFLASMFPTLKFVLVDPADFVARHRPPQIEVRQRFFTDDIAREFHGRTDVLFVCDIRTADWKVMTKEEVEAAVEADQPAQMRWHVLMKPRASMLKFRLPWGDGETLYLDGRIYLPIWGPQTTSETRLIVERDAPLRAYSHRTYEAQMFAFNVCERVHLYARVRGKVECRGLCRCYDCSAELLVVLRYFCYYRLADFDLGTGQGKLALWRAIERFIAELARKCSPQSGRQLWSAVNSETRRSGWFGGRRFDTAEQRIVDVDSETTRRGVENKKRNRRGFERQSRSVTTERLRADPVLADVVDSTDQKKRRRAQAANKVEPTDDTEYAELLAEFAKKSD